jgi:hypothetical protein
MIPAFFQPLALYSQPAGLLKKIVVLLNNTGFLLNHFFNADSYKEIYAFLIIT